MWEFIRAGGWPMLAVLALGAVTIAAAVAFAVRPADRGVALVRSLSNATAFMAVGGVAADLGAVFAQVPVHPEWSQPDQLPRMLLIGLGEAVTPAVAAFPLLTIAWLVTAVGVRRWRGEPTV